jgi:hypothetical protein
MSRMPDRQGSLSQQITKIRPVGAWYLPTMAMMIAGSPTSGGGCARVQNLFKACFRALETRDHFTSFLVNLVTQKKRTLDSLDPPRTNGEGYDRQSPNS